MIVVTAGFNGSGIKCVTIGLVTGIFFISLKFSIAHILSGGGTTILGIFNRWNFWRWWYFNYI